jgi:hypothetical protein
LSETPYTHIIVSWESNQAEKLFRASDGMYVGERAGTIVLYGEDPNAPPTDPHKRKGRDFIDTKSAAAFLREKATRHDMKVRGIEGDPVIQELPQEGMVKLAEGSIELVANGATMPAVNRQNFNRSLKN